MNILSLNSSSKKIEGLSFNYSHVSRKSEWSHCLVALHGHSNGLSLPLDFKPYLSKKYFDQQKDGVFKNELELALDTLENVKLQCEKESYVKPLMSLPSRMLNIIFIDMRVL